MTASEPAVHRALVYRNNRLGAVRSLEAKYLLYELTNAAATRQRGLIAKSSEDDTKRVAESGTVGPSHPKRPNFWYTCSVHDEIRLHRSPNAAVTKHRATRECGGSLDLEYEERFYARCVSTSVNASRDGR